MSFEKTLKNFFNERFNKKNYKYLIFFLIFLILFMLFCGNYNLVFKDSLSFEEGLTLNQEMAQLNNTMSNVGNTQNNMNNISQNYNDISNTDVGGVRTSVGGSSNTNQNNNQNNEPVIEAMTCGNENFNSVGAPGNNGANKSVNKLCNLKNLTSQSHGVAPCDSYLQTKTCIAQTSCKWDDNIGKCLDA